LDCYTNLAWACFIQPWSFSLVFTIWLDGMGPRLTLPVLGAVGVLTVYLVTPQVINFLHGSGKKHRMIILVCLVVLSSLPNLSVMLDSKAFFKKIFAPTNVEIESGIKPFIVQTAPADLYMASATEGYSRNIVLPTTFEVALQKWPVSLLWIFLLYLISRQIFSNLQIQAKTKTRAYPYNK